MKRGFILFMASLFPVAAFAQSITGNWEGTLEVQGTKIPVVFHIAEDSTGKPVASFDSPKQNAFNLPCNDVVLNGDSITLFMKILNGRYSGLLNEGLTQISGTWYQGGGKVPLTMGRTGNMGRSKQPARPQTPKPPFPYRSEDVEYDNADKTIHFGATFTAPRPDSGANYFRAPVYPTVLLITGSGKQDRDENIFNHRPFAVIADHLARQGIAVLRVDDRDMGKTTGNFTTSTTADFALDVEAGLNYLRTRKDVDTNFIGLLGHSEGGLIAPMVAAKRADVKFIILLAGPGVKITELMEQQSVDVGATRGLSHRKLEQYRILYRQLVNTIIYEPDTSKIFDKAVAVFTEWQKDKNNAVVNATTGVTDEKSKEKYIRNLIQQLSNPWYSYFMKMDPVLALKKVKCPVLALNGEKDIQVSAKENLSGITAALQQAGNNNFKIQEIPGLNHLFQHCQKCSVEEYNKLEESFAPEALDLITSWIKETIK